METCPFECKCGGEFVPYINKPAWECSECGMVLSHTVIERALGEDDNGSKPEGKGEHRVVDSVIELATERLGEDYQGCYSCPYFEVEVQVRSYVPQYRDDGSLTKGYTESPVVGNVMMICANPEHGFSPCDRR